MLISFLPQITNLGSHVNVESYLKRNQTPPISIEAIIAKIYTYFYIHSNQIFRIFLLKS